MVFSIESIPLALILILVGLFLMIYCSGKAISNSIKLASILKIPPLIVGVVFIAIGTDLPEIVNSLLSSYLGHADINVGDSLGSILSQMSLVFGILPFFGGPIVFKRREMLVIGSCLILSLIMLYIIFGQGAFSQLNAFFMIISLALFTVIIVSSLGKEEFEQPTITERKGNPLVFALWAFLGLAGVALGSVVFINSVITLAQRTNIPEYLISFFIGGLGTSLPELFVDIAAIRQKQFNIAVGDILGSCLVDATLSVSIGPLFFPHAISASLISQSMIYIIVVAMIIVGILAFRLKLDRKIGAFFIILYLLSYLYEFGFIL